MKTLYPVLAVCLSSCLLVSCGDSDNGPKRIVLGTTNILYTPNDLQYSLPFVVQVTRDDEHPASGARVDITIKPVRYFKGGYIPADTDGDNIDDAWALTYTTSCIAEDVNNNSQLDAGEDLNANGSLEPTYPGTVDEHPELSPTVTQGTGYIVTNTSGFGYFVVTYPKSEANWTRIEITATAQVDGTEENETYTITLPILVDDLIYPISPPGSSVSRYGSSAVCTDAL
jgi:hypothetical protein